MIYWQYSRVLKKSIFSPGLKEKTPAYLHPTSCLEQLKLIITRQNSDYMGAVGSVCESSTNVTTYTHLLNKNKWETEMNMIKNVSTHVDGPICIFNKN